MTLTGFRESVYRLLPQTTPENVSKNFSQYSLDPTTRYPNISLNFLKPSQVGCPASLAATRVGLAVTLACISLQMRHLCDSGESREMRIEIENVINSSTPKLARNGRCFTPSMKEGSSWIFG